MRFLHAATELWSKPCLAPRETHELVCRILEAHIDGSAHTPGGIAEQYEAREPSCQTFGVAEWRADKMYFQRGNVAVIPLVGVMGKRVDSMAKCSGMMDVDDTAMALRAAIADDNIEGIMLDVDSPGGGVTGVPELSALVREASAAKPVVAYTDSYMCSGAYYAACGAEAIYATQSASVGSIGVYMAWLDESRAYEMAGLRTELIKRGEFKAMGVRGLSLTDDQRALLQARVDEIYGWFTSAVVDSRPNVTDDTMQGQDFHGTEAVERGLVDVVGTAADAMDELLDMIAARNDSDE